MVPGREQKENEPANWSFTDYLLFVIDDQQQITAPKVQKEHLIQQLLARDTGNPQPPHVN